MAQLSMNVSAQRRIEIILAFLLSLAVLLLLMVRATHAGGLWRDECAAVQLARMPAFTDVARNFQHEAFPLLFPAVVRGFTDIFGTGDPALRCFGFIVGAMLLGVSWFNARAIEPGVPLFTLVLAGLNIGFLTWGTSLRGYGLGAVLIVLTLGLVVRLLRKVTALGVAVTLIAATASVHCLLYNAGFLFAIIGSAALVSLSRGDVKRGSIFLLIGFISLVSLIPYLPSYLGSGSWNILVTINPSVRSIWLELHAAMGTPVPILACLWYSLFAVLMGAAFWRLWTLRKAGPNVECDVVERDILLFLVLALPASLIAYFVFLRVLSYVPQPWYYVALVVLLAAGLDLLALSLLRSKWLRIGRVALAGVALLVLPIVNWPKLVERQTNIDIVARQLERSAGANDLIVVSPWQFGIPFSWYYHGRTRWVTLPFISDHRIHRYDLLKEKMISPEPVKDVMELVSNTLRSGNQVWIVGGVRFLRPGQEPLSLAPAPDPRFGWDNLAYMAAWSEQLGISIQKHALHGRPVPVPTAGRVNAIESVPIAVVQGWRQQPAVASQ
jgi:hypothetical protein